jgi:sugar lactone lactonase YvrE
MKQRDARLAGLGCLFSVLALAGCSDDDNLPPPAVTAAPAPAPGPAPVPPTITTQPAGVAVTVGQTATFTTVATGSNLTYQWRRSGADVAGANAASYTTAATVIGDSGATFSVRLCTGPQASNVCVNSASAALTVNPLALNATQIAGTPGVTGSTDGTGAVARFNTANYLAVNAAGTLYLGDFNNHTIRAITPAGVVSTLAGSPGVPGYADGTGAAARFNGNGGLAVDSAGNIFVSDWDNFVIRRITPAGVVTTFAGTAGAVGTTDGTGAAARFSNPNGMAIDAAGNLYVADWGNHTIRRITPAGVVTTLAGTPGVPGNSNGTGVAARFAQPNGVAVDNAGNVFVADASNHTIRRITPAGVVTTLAGQAGATGTTDGTGAAARFDTPAWLTISPSGDLFVVSAAGDTVRKITAAGVVTTVVGVAGQNAAVVLGASPRLRNARGVLALSSNQLVVVADNAVLNVTVP